MSTINSQLSFHMDFVVIAAPTNVRPTQFAEVGLL